MYTATPRRGAPALAGSILSGALAIFLFAAPAHAQSATVNAGPTDPPANSFSNDPTLLSVCNKYPSNACVVVASFNANLAPYWYVNGSSSNGLGGAPIYFYANGVYQSTYHANGSSNPGAITVVAPLGSNYTFLGAQVYGRCSNQAYYGQGWTNMSIPFSAGELYTLGIPYTCN
ncbi:MAG: hypothetical protein M3Y72_06130 [Acidobacteriota bacterium]|nr:hypothetical protein [Acidobacteriota bacterium]